MKNNRSELQSKLRCHHWTIALISYASKVMLKIVHARLQHYENQELPDVQSVFRKGRGTKDQIANIHWIIEKARELQKNIYLWFNNYTKPLTVWITTNRGKFWKRGGNHTILPVSWETCMQVKKQQLEPCREELTGSRLRQHSDRAVCGLPVCLTKCWALHGKCWAGWVQAGMKIGGRNIHNLRYADDTL